MKSESINELAKALCLAQKEIEPAHKNKTNPFFNSGYADLSAIWGSCKDILSNHGLCVVQTTDRDEYGIALVTTLIHTSGQWIEGNYPIVTLKQEPQSLGSAVTYARRYALMSIVGIVTDEDDDAENAMDRNGSKPVKTSQQPSSSYGSGGPTRGISEAQERRLYAIMKANRWTGDDVGEYLKKAQIEASNPKDLNVAQYDSLCNAIEKVKKN